FPSVTWSSTVSTRWNPSNRRCAITFRRLEDGARASRRTLRRRPRRQRRDRLVDQFEFALGGFGASLDGFAGAMEIEPSHLPDPWVDGDVRRIAGQARPRDAILHDVEGIRHDCRNAGTAAIARELPLNGALGAEQGAQPAALLRFMLSGGSIDRR